MCRKVSSFPGPMFLTKRQCSSTNTKEKQEINASTHRNLPKLRTKNSQILQISFARAAPPLLLGLHCLCLKLQRAATHHIDLSGFAAKPKLQDLVWKIHPSSLIRSIFHNILRKSCSSTSSSTLPCREAAPWPQRARLKGAAPSYWKGKKKKHNPKWKIFEIKLGHSLRNWDVKISKHQVNHHSECTNWCECTCNWNLD